MLVSYLFFNDSRGTMSRIDIKISSLFLLKIKRWEVKFHKTRHVEKIIKKKSIENLQHFHLHLWMWIIDAHGLKIQGEGPWGFCQILGGRVYRGWENFRGRVHFFGFLLQFCKRFGGRVQFCTPSPPTPVCIYDVDYPQKCNFYLKNGSSVFSVVVAEEGHVRQEQLLHLLQGRTRLGLPDQRGHHFQDHWKKKDIINIIVLIQLNNFQDHWKKVN